MKATKEELTEKSPEDSYLDEEAKVERLLKYDRKIDKILYCILSDREALVFNLKIGMKQSWIEIARRLNIPESTVRAINGKIERKLELFRRIFNLA